MKKLLIILSLFICVGIHSQEVVAVTPVNNQIAMSYATMSVTQMTVASTAMRAGGNFSLSVQAVDGGGRGPPNFPNDMANLTITFYNYSNGVIGTAVSNNTTVFNTWNTYTVNSTNCGGASCSQLAYLVVSFTGNDGGYWAGNAGTNFKDPKLTFTPTGQATSTTNILYNPEFGVYGTYATNSGPNGWSNSTGTWGGNTHPQLLNLSGTLNAAGGGYFSAANTGSGRAGGYPQNVSQYPSYMTVNTPAPATLTYGTSANITSAQQTRQTDAVTRQNAVGNNMIYVDQVGDNNTLTVVQGTNKNELKGIGQQDASIQGNYNNITVRQGNTNGSTSGKSLVELKVAGDTNTVSLNQGYSTTGVATGTDSNNHYQMLNLTGNSNTVTTSQTDNNSSAPGHFMETTVSGNSNSLLLKQQGSAGKTMFTNVNGNNNTVSALQDGLGAHYLETNLVGNGNSVTASQTGNIQNKASISITNAGGPGSVDLQQSGGANYNITTTCVTAGGCGAVVIRQ